MPPRTIPPGSTPSRAPSGEFYFETYLIHGNRAGRMFAEAFTEQRVPA